LFFAFPEFLKPSSKRDIYFPLQSKGAPSGRFYPVVGFCLLKRLIQAKQKDSRASKRRTYHKKAVAIGVPLISLLFTAAALLPSYVHASILSDIVAMFTQSANADEADSDTTFGNLQTMPLLRPAMNISPTAARGGGDVTIVDDSAVVAAEGPSGTLADIEKPKNGTISTYVVRDGDTLSDIAKLFDVTPGTILSANDLPNASSLKPGQKLIILPITGIDYTVKQGDTLASIAKAYGGDPAEIASYNSVDDSSLAVGMTVLVPNGEVSATHVVASVSTDTGTVGHKTSGKIRVGNEPAHDVGPQGTAAEIAYYIPPVANYIETQGIHGYNAVDLAAPSGTPIVASAAGTVVVAREGGWNGGYGSYVVISHDNGSQTLYAHMSKVAAYDGETVTQGQLIGYVGKTGLATGPHVHFEIRDGIKNPF
jgi:murein DD-endopeptidase MepM/ murein hydrolase activator NlpD